MARIALRAHLGAAPAEARELRRRVFVGEQGVDPAEEWDVHDEPGADTLHFVASGAGHALGCARLRRADDGAAKIERVAVLQEARRLGVGRALMDAAETAAWRRGDARLRVHAQTAVVPFYERLGW